MPELLLLVLLRRRRRRGVGRGDVGVRGDQRAAGANRREELGGKAGGLEPSALPCRRLGAVLARRQVVVGPVHGRAQL